MQQLHQLCTHLLADQSTVILVDNTEAPYLYGHQLATGCSLITLGRNTGIAHAQNVGIAAATATGAEVLAFFDQDSTIETGLLRALVVHLNVGVADVVSPVCFDDASNTELPSVRLNQFGIAFKVRRGNSLSPYPVDLVISSGTVATREAFEVAGLFDDGLFMDNVDHEWCLRCRSRSVPIRVVPSAVMRHRIGTRWIRLGVVTVVVHSPIRCYYQIRNTFQMFRKRHVPFVFASREMAAVFLNRALLILFMDDKLAYAKAYLDGLRDGIKGVTGPKPG